MILASFYRRIISHSKFVPWASYLVIPSSLFLKYIIFWSSSLDICIAFLLLHLPLLHLFFTFYSSFPSLSSLSFSSPFYCLKLSPLKVLGLGREHLNEYPLSSSNICYSLIISNVYMPNTDKNQWQELNESFTNKINILSSLKQYLCPY